MVPPAQADQGLQYFFYDHLRTWLGCDHGHDVKIGHTRPNSDDPGLSRSLRSPDAVDASTPANMVPSMGHRGIQVVEEVALRIKVCENARGCEYPSVLGSRPLNQDRDPTPVELLDDLGERLCPGRVDERQTLHAKDYDTHSYHLTEPCEEARCCSEEESAVESEDGDVV